MNKWKYGLGFLVLVVATLIGAIVTFPEEKLRLVACDVGQGDATLIIYGEVQILVDAGRGKKVLDCLGGYLPFWDRQIELVLITHPDADHYGGFLDVFENYSVDEVVVSGLENSNQTYELLENKVGGSGTKVVYATSGLKVRVGLMQFEILHPSGQFLAVNSAVISDPKDKKVLGAFTSSVDKNDFSIVAMLSLGEFDALLTGDIGSQTMKEIIDSGNINNVEYLKVPHHGSRNNLPPELLESTNPELAVISVGKNSYGHPHGEVLDLLRKEEIKTLRTDEVGDIVVETNGEQFWIE